MERCRTKGRMVDHEREVCLDRRSIAEMKWHAHAVMVKEILGHVSLAISSRYTHARPGTSSATYRRV